MKLTAHWPNNLEMPKVVHNVQFTMTNVQSVLLIGQSVVEFIEVFRSMTNCRIYRRIVMEHWPNANEKRCTSSTLKKKPKVKRSLEINAIATFCCKCWQKVAGQSVATFTQVLIGLQTFKSKVSQQTNSLFVFKTLFTAKKNVKRFGICKLQFTNRRF